MVSLRERDKNLIGSNSRIKVGEVVLIHDDVPRVQWKLGLVNELFFGRDGIVRSVLLKTSNGEISRPVIKCYPLEVCDEYKEGSEISVNEKRPLRKAAAVARAAIFEQLK